MVVIAQKSRTPAQSTFTFTSIELFPSSHSLASPRISETPRRVSLNTYENSIRIRRKAFPTEHRFAEYVEDIDSAMHHLIPVNRPGKDWCRTSARCMAQREACEAYVKAEAGEDGGFLKTAYDYDDLSSEILSVRIGRPTNAIAILAPASTPATVQSKALQLE